jgi:hypothetical protein
MQQADVTGRSRLDLSARGRQFGSKKAEEPFISAALHQRMIWKTAPTEETS